MKINVCVPTLNRPDMLRLSISKLQQSRVLPDSITVIDNGGMFCLDAQNDFYDDYGIHHHYWRPENGNIGVAASWNWFANRISEMRVIMNDDVFVYPDTLQLLSNAYDERVISFPAGISATNVFSCFVMSNFLHRELNGFDELISPNYGYYEDNDLARRLILAGYSMRGVPNCSVDHHSSSTLKAYTDAEMNEHHRKFEIAKANYIRKWAGLPGQEQWDTPYNQKEAV